MRIIFVFMVFVSSIYAHKLNIFLEQEEKKVFVSAYFASGAFCKSCKIEVLNSNNKLLQTGKTDENGEFVITSLDSVLHVGVDAGSGHFVKKSITLQTSQKDESISKEIQELKEENRRLKSQIKLLKEKNSMTDIFKTIFALLIVAGIFFLLKRVKK